MNYWLITSEFPPMYGGGISTYCMATVQMLAQAGHNITVITPDQKVSELTIQKRDKYTLVQFNPAQSSTSDYIGYEANLSFSFAQAMKALMEISGVPDVLESQEYMGIAYYILQYKWMKYPLFQDLKVLLTLHAPSFLYLEYNQVNMFRFPYYWIGEMEKFCIRAADILISPSEYLVHELDERMNLKGLDIRVIPNPYAMVGGEKPNTLFTKRKVVFFGKLTPQKGCMEILAYFKKMWAQGYEATLSMIGGGNHLFHPEGMDMIDFLKKKYQLEIASGKLQFIGSLAPDKINKVLDEAHVIVVPSIVDNLPYTVLEAMSRNKLVLVSAQGGQAEVMTDGVNGFIFDHQVPDSFEQKLNQIFSLTDSEADQIGKNASAHVLQRYGTKRILDEKMAFLNEALASLRKGNSLFPFIYSGNPIGNGNLPFPGEIPLLSIVIPYYNMGSYIDDTIASLYASTYVPFEIIIVNDGSRKEDSDLLMKYEAKKEIRVLHKNNEGLSRARNQGAQEAKGHYLAFLDADDTVAPTYYAKAIQVLGSYENVHFVGCWAQYFGDSDGIWVTYNPEPPYILYHNSINSSALVYKRDAFLRGGLNDPKMIYGMEDYESVIHLLAKGFHGVVLPEVLWNYRVRKKSMARLFTTEKKQYLYRLMAQKHESFYAIFASDLTCLLNSNGPGMLYDNPTFPYNFPEAASFNGKIKQWIISKIKSKPVLRKAALKMKRIYKKL